MNKERFNQLLGNLHEVTNEDIKSLNELRKKYPFFQTPYVIVAKALKERNHPKTEAFIKKAAIYSPDRSHLKRIILGEVSSVEIKKTVKLNSISETEKPTLATQQPTEKEASVPEKEVTEAAPSMSKAPLTASVSPELSQLDDDLKEIKERKRRLAEFLENQEKSLGAAVPRPPRKLKSQVELIEKFIHDQPQFEQQRGSGAEDEYNNEDLATKNLRPKDEFVTETLAKLMFKQKKYNRALDIYEKLSLKFPEKSTYFATQIKKIKEAKNV